MFRFIQTDQYRMLFSSIQGDRGTGLVLTISHWSLFVCMYIYITITYYQYNKIVPHCVNITKESETGRGMIIAITIIILIAMYTIV